MFHRILALDPGEKRVGAALSDPTGTIATGLATIAVSTVDGLVDAVERLCAENGVTEIVVGFPLNMDGSEGPKAIAARDLAGRIGERLPGIPVHLHDERLTTVQSHEILREGGMHWKKRKALVDQMAARILLTEFLEARRRG